VTKSIGNGVPADTDRKRAMIKIKVARKITLPIMDVILNLMYHPIPIAYVYIFLDILYLC